MVVWDGVRCVDGWLPTSSRRRREATQQVGGGGDEGGVGWGEVCGWVVTNYRSPRHRHGPSRQVSARVCTAGMMFISGVLPLCLHMHTTRVAKAPGWPWSSRPPFSPPRTGDVYQWHLCINPHTFPAGDTGLTVGQQALATFDFFTTMDWYWGGIGYLWGATLAFVAASTLALTFLTGARPRVCM